MVSNISIKLGVTIGAIVVYAISHKEMPVTDVNEGPRVPAVIDPASPPCLQVYNYIKAYADSFDIPLRYAYGIANTETSYGGPFHWTYDPAQTSSAGAVGPMQVMVATAHWINKDDVTKEELRTNIRYNVYTSMKLLRKLYDKNHDWKTSFGEYNTGRPCVNGYAHKVYNYQPNW